MLWNIIQYFKQFYKAYNDKIYLFCSFELQNLTKWFLQEYTYAWIHVLSFTVNSRNECISPFTVVNLYFSFSITSMQARNIHFWTKTFSTIIWACTHIMYQCLYIWPIFPCIMVNVFKLCGRVLNKPYIHLCTKTLATGYWACIHVMYQWHYISYNCYTQSSFYLTSPF